MNLHLKIYLCLLLQLIYACDDKEPSKPIADMEIDQEIDMLLPDMGTMLSSRCPELKTGNYFLVLYPDRIEAFQRDKRGFKISRSCTFIALHEQGIQKASAFVRLNDGRFVIAEPGEMGGVIYVYDAKGAFERKDNPNINLTNIQGLWLNYEGKLVAWNQTNENLYLLDENASFVGSFKPPQSSNAKLSKLKDLIFVAPDDKGERMVALFEDAPPKLFAFPMPLSWDASVIASGKSIAGIPSQIGTKLLISGDINGNGGGIALYRPIQSGRALPEVEKLDLVIPGDPGYGDGAELVAVEEGMFFVLDQGSQGTDTQSLNSFNSFGIPQEQNPLPAVESNAKAIDVIYTNLILE